MGHPAAVFSICLPQEFLYFIRSICARWKLCREPLQHVLDLWLNRRYCRHHVPDGLQSPVLAERSVFFRTNSFDKWNKILSVRFCEEKRIGEQAQAAALFE